VAEGDGTLLPARHYLHRIRGKTMAGKELGIPSEDPLNLLSRATGCIFGESGGRPFCDLIVDQKELRVAFGSEAEARAFRTAARAAGLPVETDRHLVRLWAGTIAASLLLLAAAHFVIR